MNKQQQDQKRFEENQKRAKQAAFKARVEELEEKEFALREWKVEVEMMEIQMKYAEVTPVFNQFRVKQAEEAKKLQESIKAQPEVAEPEAAGTEDKKPEEDANTQGEIGQEAGVQ